MPHPKAMFVGAANLDRHATLLEPHRAATSNRATITETAGGVTLNIASRFAACGGAATLVAPVASDGAGLMIRSTLAERGVQLAAAESERTGTFLSILEPDGELVTAVSDMAAMETFMPDLPAGPFDWTLLDSNLTAPALKHAAQQTTSRIALATTSIAKAPRLAGILERAEIVFTNIPELAELSGGAAEPFQWFRQQTAATLVASDGPRPLWLMDRSEVNHFAVHHSPTIVDVIGAGDALAGTMLYQIASGADIKDAVASGLEASARIVQIAGPYLPPEA